MMKKNTWVLLPVFVAFSMMSCSHHIEETPIMNDFCLGDFKSKIELIEPQKQLISENIHLNGSVEENPDKLVNYTSLVDGIITQTHFILGEKVNKGQILAEIKSTSLSEMRMESQSISEQIKTAERNLESVQSMYNDGIASYKQLLEAQGELNILKAEKTKTASNLDLYNASSSSGSFLIKAPITGIITAKNIVPGTQITAGTQELFTISDLEEVWVMVNIYASNVKNVIPGMTVDIKTLSYPDEVFKGKIASITQVFDQESKVLKAKVIMPNKDLKLKPGMLVDIMVEKRSDQSAWAVPLSSLVFDDNQNFLIIYRSDCDLEIRKVNVFAQNNEWAYIDGEPDNHEKIVSKNQLLIYEQLKRY